MIGPLLNISLRDLSATASRSGYCTDLMTAVQSVPSLQC